MDTHGATFGRSREEGEELPGQADEQLAVRQTLKATSGNATMQSIAISPCVVPNLLGLDWHGGEGAATTRSSPTTFIYLPLPLAASIVSVRSLIATRWSFALLRFCLSPSSRFEHRTLLLLLLKTRSVSPSRNHLVERLRSFDE